MVIQFTKLTKRFWNWLIFAKIKGISEILIVTGKGIHSKKENSVYTSEKLTNSEIRSQNLLKTVSN